MKISEVCDKFNLSSDTLRYYEKIGLIENVRRINRQRDYQEKDINRIDFVVCMRDAGLSIDFLSQYINLYNQGNDTADERKQLLIDQRDILQERLNAIQKSLNRLNFKIGQYESIMIEHEKELL